MALPTASDNKFPKLIITEGSAPSSPSAGDQKLFVDSSDHLLKLKNSAGTVTTIGSGLSDPMTTRGDLIARNAANATARLAVGAAGKILSSDGTDVSWGNGPMTTAGDLIIGGASGLPTRLAAGATSGHVLTSNGSGVAPSYQAAGGSGTTIQYGSLKPGSPTDDFNASSLDGAWSAHSSIGSFATTDCFTQAVDGSHLSMGFNAKMGCLYRTASNVDLTLEASGMYSTILTTTSAMFGIAALNSSGTGVGVVAYSDGNAYLASITGWQYSGILQTISGYGRDKGIIPMNFKLVRTTNSWVGSVSMDGMNWVASASGSTTITVDRVAIGLFYDTSATYRGRLFCDAMKLS